MGLERDTMRNPIDACMDWVLSAPNQHAQMDRVMGLANAVMLTAILIILGLRALGAL